MREKIKEKVKYWKLDNIYLFKVNNENIRTMCGICSRLTIKTPKQRR